jgi:hypothetical protein
MRNIYNIMVGKPEGERPLRRPKHIKVKVKLSLCLTKHHARKTYWGVEV